MFSEQIYVKYFRIFIQNFDTIIMHFYVICKSTRPFQMTRGINQVIHVSPNA
jgi:sulfatase maturation enzyme AslB (radical SAM superfamily)